jgi:branched-chain amino acid aminotransferase
MTMVFMMDGALVPSERATVSVLDRGFLYGDSVFETIRTYGGKPFALDEHMQRLHSSASRVSIDFPVPLARFRDEVITAVASSTHAESYARVMLTRGTGETLGLDPNLALTPLRVVIVGPLQPPPLAAYEHGISAVTYKTQRPTEATEASGAKVGNYLVAVLAMREARKTNASEALIVDAAGHVVEGATSNVFALIAGRLVTPPESAGILAGITRNHLLEVARELGLGVELRLLTVPELLAAEEVFISSSIRELLAVVSVDGRPIGSGKPGPVTTRLLRVFQIKARRSAGLGA